MIRNNYLNSLLPGRGEKVSFTRAIEWSSFSERERHPVPTIALLFTSWTDAHHDPISRHFHVQGLFVLVILRIAIVAGLYIWSVVPRFSQRGQRFVS